MIRKKIIIGFSTVVLTFVGLLSTNVSSVNAGSGVTIQGESCYGSMTDIPLHTTIGGVKCHLVERKSYDYKSGYEHFIQEDHCRWNMYDVTMHFVYGTGWEWMEAPNYNVRTARVGSRDYTFTCNVYTHRDSTHMSQYLPPGGSIPLHGVNGQWSVNYRTAYAQGLASGKPYGEYWFDANNYDGGGPLPTKIHNMADWVGPGNVIHGNVYYTGYHDYYRWFTQTIYYGIYEPDESHPYLYTAGIANHQYEDKDTNIFWYKHQAGGSTETYTHIGFKDTNSDISRLYPFYYYDGNLVLKSFAYDNDFNAPRIQSKNGEYVDKQMSVARDVGVKHADVYFKTWFKKPGVYTVSASSYSKNGFWQDPSRDEFKPVETGLKLGLDEIGPNAKTIEVTDSSDINFLRVKASGFTDYADNAESIKGSGYSNVKVAVYPNDPKYSYKGPHIWTTLTNTSSDVAEGTCYYAPEFDGVYGEFRADFYIYDNVGNYRVKSVIFQRANPKPEKVEVNLTGWNYSEPGTNYRWYNLKTNLRVETTAYSNVNYSKLDFGYPSNVTTWFNQFKYADLSTKIKNKIPYVESRFFDGKNLYDNFSSSDFTKVAVTRARGVSNGLKTTNTVITMKPNKAAEGRMIYSLGSAYTYLNGKYYYYKNNKNAYVNEKDGDVACIDGTAPALTWKKTGRHYIQYNVKDALSGIKRIEILTTDGKLLSSQDFSTKGKDSYSGMLGFDTGAYKELIIRTTDNVNNSKDYSLKNLLTIIDPMFIIDDEFPIDPDNVGDRDVNLVFKGVIRGGRKNLKVQATGKITNPVPDFTPIYRFNGTGENVIYSNVGSPVIAEVKNEKLDRTTYIDDTVNTPEAPVIQYNRSSIDSSLTWNKLEDVPRLYDFSIWTKVSDWEPFEKEIEVTQVKFMSGYKDYHFVVYPCADASGVPNGDAVIDKRSDTLECSMNNIRTGWYRVEVTMYDFNDNPSGTGVLIFYHDQPALFSPFDVTVDAVKDVDWEGIGSLDYGETQTDSNKHYFGAQHDLFPLGKNCTADGTTLRPDGTGNNIAKGYAVHYSFHKENEDELTDFYITYKFYTPEGKLLKLYKEDKLLSYEDSSQHTTYTKKTFTKEEIANMNDLSKSTYVVHFLPVNFTAKLASSGASYVGDVLVRMEFHMEIDGTVAKVQKFDLYQVDMTKTALDDIDNDKQR